MIERMSFALGRLERDQLAGTGRVKKRMSRGFHPSCAARRTDWRGRAVLATHAGLDGDLPRAGRSRNCHARTTRLGSGPLSALGRIGPHVCQHAGTPIRSRAAHDGWKPELIRSSPTRAGEHDQRRAPQSKQLIALDHLKVPDADGRCGTSPAGGRVPARCEPWRLLFIAVPFGPAVSMIVSAQARQQRADWLFRARSRWPRPRSSSLNPSCGPWPKLRATIRSIPRGIRREPARSGSTWSTPSTHVGYRRAAMSRSSSVSDRDRQRMPGRNARAAQATCVPSSHTRPARC